MKLLCDMQQEYYNFHFLFSCYVFFYSLLTKIQIEAWDFLETFKSKLGTCNLVFGVLGQIVTIGSVYTSCNTAQVFMNVVLSLKNSCVIPWWVSVVYRIPSPALIIHALHEKLNVLDVHDQAT